MRSPALVLKPVVRSPDFASLTHVWRSTRHVSVVARIHLPSCGTYSILFNFRRVKAATAPERRLLEYTDYNVVAKDAQIAESTFVHEKFTGNDTHLVIATTKGDVFCAGG